MTKKIILWAYFFILSFLFLSPPANAVAVKLSKAAQDNLGINTKGMPTRDNSSAKFECIRNKDCGETKYCFENKCKTCTYSCPSGLFEFSTGKCASVVSSVLGNKSNPVCRDQNVSCYSAGVDCSNGTVCSGNTCVACTYSCPSGLSKYSTGKCTSIVSSVLGNKSNPVCRDQNVSCYSAGVDCSSGTVCSGNTCVCPSETPIWNGTSCVQCTQDNHCSSSQKCSSNKCVGKCDGVFCSGLKICDPSTGGCYCPARTSCCTAGSYYSSSACDCLPLSRPPCSKSLKLEIDYQASVFLKHKKEGVLTILTRLFGVSPAYAKRLCLSCARDDYNCIAIREQCLAEGSFDFEDLCTPPANGYCSGRTVYCNSGYQMRGGICTPKTPKKDDAGCNLYKYVCS